MTTSDASAEELESTYDRGQQMVGVGAVGGSVGLALQNIASELAWSAPVIFTIMAVTTVGWLVFLRGVMMVRSIGRAPGGTDFLNTVTSDERLLTIRAKAYSGGFFAMILLQVIFTIAWVLAGDVVSWLTIGTAASITVAAGVSASVLRFQSLSSS